VPGSLTVVGTGIRFGIQLTPEARAVLLAADRAFYLAAEPVARRWLGGLRPDARSLHTLYEPGRPRAEAYAGMVDAILEPVREGRSVCAAFYGHPGVFVTPSHEAIRQARAEGHEARMLPGISAEDCLFADLGLDPGLTGCLSYEATDFLVHRRPVDPGALLVLWQIGVVGAAGPALEPDPRWLGRVVERLLGFYSGDREAILYEASPYPVGDPTVQRVELGRLSGEHVTAAATLVIPP
jgi:tetrapyrrole (corrin/porphyrin) methylase-like protein